MQPSAEVFASMPRMEALPPDRRLREIRHNETPCPAPSFTDKESWLRRSTTLRRQILASAGLWPWPERTPLNAVVSPPSFHDGFTVAKVYFESLPGFFVTGNLYRPINASDTPKAAILNPHGHWKEGRLHHDKQGSIPARCITFARLGYVAFAYDMVGYVDSRQVEHRYADWANALWGISIFGLQLWNSIRAVDFLASLPDVDPDRIGCTGASGGGTQTFFLTAVDQRIRVSAPVNMISAQYQGGCICENAPGLRIGTQSVEFAAMMAPRPMLMVSATGDWTVNTPRLEYPAIRQIYALFDATERIAYCQVHAPHNYNETSRAFVYKWFLRWLPPENGTAPATFTSEGEIELPATAELCVFPNREYPPCARDQAGVFSYLKKRSQTNLHAHTPATKEGLARVRSLYGPLWQQLFPPVPSSAVKAHRYWHGVLDAPRMPHDAEVRLLWLGREAEQAIPAMLLTPTGHHSDQLTIFLHPTGKAALLDPEMATQVQDELDQGHQVLGLDLFLQGDYQSPSGITGRPHTTSHFTTYHYTDAALQVEDATVAIRWAHALPQAARLKIVAFGPTGPLALCAVALLSSSNHPAAQPELLRVTAELSGMSGDDECFLQQLFVPGIRLAGDLRVAVALTAPIPLTLKGADQLPPSWLEWMHVAYETAGKADAFYVQ